jgi:hypothetical protein
MPLNLQSETFKLVTMPPLSKYVEMMSMPAFPKGFEHKLMVES